jgi:CDP-diglyceride synthetase
VYGKGVTQVDAIFDWCVEVLVYFAGVFGITYKEINVWVFVIIWPILTLALVVLLVIRQVQIRRLEKMVQAEKS